jgi:hypothetical protein
MNKLGGDVGKKRGIFVIYFARKVVYLLALPWGGDIMEWWLLHLVPSDTLFKFQLINSKHKLLKYEIVMNIIKIENKI